jgi:hypothetical protein
MIRIVEWLYDVVEALLLKIGKLYYYLLRKEGE